MNKQIEEMAKVIDEYTEPLSVRDIHKAEFSEKFAEALYTAGYRKQSEGEWVFEFTLDDDDFYKCSVCGEQVIVNGLCIQMEHTHTKRKRTSDMRLKCRTMANYLYRLNPYWSWSDMYPNISKKGW